MLTKQYLESLRQEIQTLKDNGLYKWERDVVSPQSSEIDVEINGKVEHMLNFCANNYLGLASNKEVVQAAKDALDKHGFGVGAGRFVCGTTPVNHMFEKKISDFLGYDDAITFPSCFQANNGVFQALFDQDDAIITANLNHASLIDGIRLCKAKRFFYQFDDMADLETKIKEAIDAGANKKIIVTDGVFSMDGDIVDLQSVVKLAKKYGCMVMVDDSHGTGAIGEHGRGTLEYCGVDPKDVDIVSSTIGKALGGSTGGFIVSCNEIVDKLRNSHRGYLFSNNLISSVAAASAKAVDLISSPGLLERLRENTKYFREEIVKLGFETRPGEHPVVPVMLYDAKLASDVAKFLLEEQNIYVVAFSFPVVPKDKARIRVQISAAHNRENIDALLAAFKVTGKKFNIIK